MKDLDILFHSETFEDHDASEFSAWQGGRTSPS